jgi:hypothetical protein
MFNSHEASDELFTADTMSSTRAITSKIKALLTSTDLEGSGTNRMCTFDQLFHLISIEL